MGKRGSCYNIFENLCNHTIPWGPNFRLSSKTSSITPVAGKSTLQPRNVNFLPLFPISKKKSDLYGIVRLVEYYQNILVAHLNHF